MVDKKTTKKKAAPKKATKKGGAKGSAKSAASKRSSAGNSRAHKSVKRQDPAIKNAVARATLRDVRISPRKARLILNVIKGKQIEPALQALEFMPKKGAVITKKLLESAISNAREHARADVDRLWVTGGWVDMGRTIFRFMPRAQGRASPIRKRCSHITILLGER